MAVTPTVSQWTANILFNGFFKLSSADLSVKKNPINMLFQYVLNILSNLGVWLQSEPVTFDH